MLHWLYDFRKGTGMHLKATCAPHYYRIMRQRAHAEGLRVTPETFGMDAMTAAVWAARVSVLSAIPARCSPAAIWNSIAAMYAKRLFRASGARASISGNSAISPVTRASAARASFTRSAAVVAPGRRAWTGIIWARSPCARTYRPNCPEEPRAPQGRAAVEPRCVSLLVRMQDAPRHCRCRRSEALAAWRHGRACQQRRCQRHDAACRVCIRDRVTRR